MEWRWRAGRGGPCASTAEHGGDGGGVEGVWGWARAERRAMFLLSACLLLLGKKKK